MKRTPYLVGGGGGKDPRRRLRASRAQESALAKDLGGKVQVASGARWDKEGDVIAEELVVEAKMTEKKSYSVTLDVWAQITRQAIEQNKRPVLAVQIQKQKLAVISWSDFLALLHRDQDETP